MRTAVEVQSVRRKQNHIENIKPGSPEYKWWTGLFVL